MLVAQYDTYVFDTAPRPTPVACWACPGISLCVNKMLKSREEAPSLRELLSFHQEKEGPIRLMEYLVSFRDRHGQGRVLFDRSGADCLLLRDARPRALPIGVITSRFIGWFQ